MTRRKADELAPPPEHGSARGYLRHAWLGDRNPCDECRAAWATFAATASPRNRPPAIIPKTRQRSQVF